MVETNVQCEARCFVHYEIYNVIIIVIITVSLCTEFDMLCMHDAQINPFR